MNSILLGYNLLSLFRYAQLFKASIKFRRVSTVKPGKNVTLSTISGDITVEDRIEPVKIAYTSYEATSPMVISTDCPIIIMHGLLGSKSNWNSLSRTILSQTKRKVIAVDARNHGDSTHSPKMSYDHLAEDVKALMKEQSITKASLIGHSMGGRAMMRLSLKYPELVEKLIVVEISPISTSHTFNHMQKYFDAMNDVKFEPNVPINIARKIANDQLATTIPNPGVRKFFLTNMVEAENGRFKWRIDVLSIARNLVYLSTFPDPGGKVFDKPTLFVSGGKSDSIQEEDRPKIKAIFTKVKFETIPDAGHWVHAEKPVEFINVVTNFLQENTETKA